MSALRPYSHFFILIPTDYITYFSSFHPSSLNYLLADLALYRHGFLCVFICLSPFRLALLTPQTVNPFAHRETHSDRCLLMYRVWVPLTWFVAVLFSVYYSIRAPADVEHGHTIPRQAEKHITAFSQNLIVTGIYWYDMTSTDR